MQQILYYKYKKSLKLHFNNKSKNRQKLNCEYGIYTMNNINMIKHLRPCYSLSFACPLCVHRCPDLKASAHIHP